MSAAATTLEKVLSGYAEIQDAEEGGTALAEDV